MIRSAILASLAGLLSSVVAAVPASAQANAGGTDYFVERVVDGVPSNSCLGYWPNEPDPVGAATPCGADHMVWNLTDVGNGQYRVVNKKSGLVLEIDPGEVTVDGAHTRLANVRTTGAISVQQWRFQPNGRYYNIVNQASGRNLTHRKSYAAVFNPNPTDTRVQIWYLRPIL